MSDNKLHRGTTAKGREEVLVALRAAAQKKGSPLNDAELHAVYDQFEDAVQPVVNAKEEAERLSKALSVK
jgi:hypothetical protein